jgi:hypothetical protein
MSRSQLSVKDTPALSRSPVEVEDEVKDLNVLPCGWQHMTPHARRLAAMSDAHLLCSFVPHKTDKTD